MSIIQLFVKIDSLKFYTLIGSFIYERLED